MEIKYVLVIIIILLSCNPKLYKNLGKIQQNERNKINDHVIKLAENILENDCREDPNPEKYFDGTDSKRKQFQIHNIDSLDIIPISLFKVSSKGNKYNGTGIINFLEWESNELMGFYTFKDGNFEGLLDWSGEHHFDLKKECAYFTIHNNSFTIQESYLLGYKHLIDKRRDTSFLFGVKYFVETLWFVEEGRIFVLDLNKFQIYNPDEFINRTCYKGFIEDIAKGGQVQCNL